MNNDYIYIIFIIGFFLIILFNRRNNGEKFNTLGLENLNKGEYQQAISAFNDAIAATSTSTHQNVKYLWNMSLAYHELGDLISARKCSERALAHCQVGSYNFHIHKGQIELFSDDINSAIINFKKALKFNPETTEADNSLGLIYLGDYGAAYTNLEQALVHNTRTDDVLDRGITKHVLGRNYYLMQDYNRAETLFREAINRNEKDLNSIYALALICYYLGKKAESKILFDEVVSLDSSYAKGEIETILLELGIEI